MIRKGEVELVVNSPRGHGPRADGRYIRAAAANADLPVLTTATAALATASGLADWSRHRLAVRSLQEYHGGIDGKQLQLALG